MFDKNKGWRSVGYISLSRRKSCVLIKIEKEYYVAELPDVLEALTKQRGYAKIYKKEN